MILSNMTNLLKVPETGNSTNWYHDRPDTSIIRRVNLRIKNYLSLMLACYAHGYVFVANPSEKSC